MSTWLITETTTRKRNYIFQWQSSWNVNVNKYRNNIVETKKYTVYLFFKTLDVFKIEILLGDKFVTNIFF